VIVLNAERLHIIAKALEEELTTGKSVEHLQQLATALQQTVKQPQQPQFQEQGGSTSHQTLRCAQ
jgi:hypothetical protein